MAAIAFGVGTALTAETGKLKVFVSYSRADLEFADQLVAALELCGFSPNIDRHGISGGEAWQQRLGALILEADTVVFVLSPDSARSEICAWEVAEAARIGKRILPVVPRPLEDAVPPQQLRDLNYIFFYNEPRSPGSGFGSGLAVLVGSLNTDLSWIREHTRLQERATEWESGGRQAARLLSGNDITLAKTWAARRPKTAPDLTPLHLEFIRASEDEASNRANAERKRLAEMAAAQSQRGKALQDAEKALREAAEAQRAKARAQQIIMWGSIAAAAIMAVVLGFATLQWREAKRQETMAKDNLYEAVISRARSTIDKGEIQVAQGRNWIAVLLALEALDVDTKKFDDHPFWIPGADRLLKMLLLKSSFKNHTMSITDLLVTADGKRIMTASIDKSVLIRDAATGRVIQPTIVEADAVSRIAATTGGLRIAIGTFRGQTRVLEHPSSRELMKFAHPTGKTTSVSRLTFLPGSNRLVAGYADGAIQVVDAMSATPTLQLKGHLYEITGLAATPDGKRIISTSLDNQLIVWDAATGIKLNTIMQPTQALSIAIAPDGNQFATGGADKFVRITDLRSGATLLKLEGHTASIRALAYTPDGRRIVTGAEDATVRLWDLKTPSVAVEIGSHFSPIKALAVTPDGSAVITAGGDGTRPTGTKQVWVWALPPLQQAGVAPTVDLVETAKKVVPRCLTISERGDFILKPEPPAWCSQLEKRRGKSTDSPQTIAEKYGSYADRALKNGDFPNALKAADLAIKLDPDATWILINKAHALMFLGRAVEAREMYLAYRGRTLNFGNRTITWEAATLEDFEKLGALGLKTDMMEDIRKLFAAPAATTAAATTTK